MSRWQTVTPVPSGERARVSVVVPSYNYARYLPAAVGSALAQDDVDVDVVIVDDASTDDTGAVLERLQEDPRVRVVVHERNLGHVETYNEALGYATGEFVVKLDADDLLSPGSLARSAALMGAYPDVAFCYGQPLEFRDAPPSDVADTARSWSIWDGTDWTRRVLRRGHNVILQPEVMLRRSAVEATGGYRTRLRWAEDYNWWLRLAAIGRVGRVNGAVQGFYRVHGDSLQRSAEDLELSDLRARVDAVSLFFAESGPAADPDGSLRRLAYRSLLKDARALAARALDRDEGAREANAAFEAVASHVERELGERVRRGPSAQASPLGRAARDLQWRIRWRRWQRWGI